MTSSPAHVPRPFWALAVLLLPALCCEVSPEKARAKLADQGISFTAEEFVRRAEKDSWPTLELFLRAGMDPNRKADVSRTLEGVTALMVASHAGREDVVERLRKAGADVNAKTRQGNSALMYAAEACSSQVVKTLIQSGAEVNHENRRGDTALIWAIPATWPADAPPSAADCINQLLAAGGGINHKSRDDDTPLHAAISKKQFGLVRLLLLRGADPNLRGGPLNFSPLNHAVRNDSAEIAEALIRAGANAREPGLMAWVSSGLRSHGDQVREVLRKAGAQ